MKFTCSVDIALPIDKTVALWDNPDNLKKWQDGFLGFESISGTPGQEGSKSKLLYKMGGGKMELLETVTKNNLPHEFSGLYEHKHMTNTMSNKFTALDANKTRWEADIEYIELKALVPRLMFNLFPGIARKQTQKWLDQFKEFAEKEGNL